MFKKAFQLLLPAVIFLIRGDIGVVIKYGQFKVPIQQLQHGAGAWRAASVQKQSRPPFK